MDSDTPLQRVRKARIAISAECDLGPKKLVEHDIKLQERHHDRLVGGIKTPTLDILSELSEDIDT
jgi:hypothetical protein